MSMNSYQMAEAWNHMSGAGRRIKVGMTQRDRWLSLAFWLAIAAGLLIEAETGADWSSWMALSLWVGLYPLTRWVLIGQILSASSK